MNDFLSLAHLNSTSNLSTRFHDIFYVFVIPLISMGAIPFKLVSICVLIIIVRQKHNRRDKAKQFYYLLTFEIFDLIQAVILCFGALLRCGSFCWLGYNFVTKIFDLAFYTYGIHVCLLVQTIMEIYFCLDRLKLLSITVSRNKKIRFRTKLASAIIISFILAAPNYLVAKQIIPVAILMPSNQTLYIISKRAIFESFYWKIGLILFILLGSPILLLILLIINIILVFKLNKYRRYSQSLQTESRISKEIIKFSKLVLAMNANFIIGFFPKSLAPILLIFLPDSNSFAYRFYLALSSLLLIFSHFNYIFIYLYRSHSFKKTLFHIIDNF